MVPVCGSRHGAILIKDRSLAAEVHRYRHLMGRLGQLDEQMATIEKEMAMLIPQKHQCVDRLMKAQAVRHVRKEIRQHIRRALLSCTASVFRFRRFGVRSELPIG